MAEEERNDPEPEAPKKKAAKRAPRKTAASKKEPEPTEPAPAAEAAPAAEPAPAAEEVPSEPFDSSRDQGPTVDMPPPGAGAKTASGSTALAATVHLLGLADLTVSIFLIGVLAPLVMWLVLKDTDPEVDYHGKESINFQLNVLFWWLIGTILTLCTFGLLGFLVVPVLMVGELVLVIMAAVAAANGDRYRYPFIYRILQ